MEQWLKWLRSWPGHEEDCVGRAVAPQDGRQPPVVLRESMLASYISFQQQIINGLPKS